MGFVNWSAKLKEQKIVYIISKGSIFNHFILKIQK